MGPAGSGSPGTGPAPAGTVDDTTSTAAPETVGSQSPREGEPSRGDRVRGRLAGLPVTVRPLLRPLGLYAASRLLVLLASAVGALLATEAGRPQLTSGPWPQVSGTGVGALDGLLRWDSAWYATIAAGGYPETAVDERIAFFPLFPGLVRALMAVTGLGPTTAGLLAASSCGALATVLVWVLGRRLSGEQAADRMAALFAFFPGSFTLSMVYAEGLLIVLAPATLLALDARRWVWAGTFAALATATRPNSVAVGAACVWAAFVALRQHRDWRALAAPALAPLGILAYFGYLYQRTGEPLAWFVAQREVWRERVDPLAQLDRVLLLLEDPLSPDGSLNTTVPVVGMLVIVVAFIALWRWRPGGNVVAYAVVSSAMVLTSASIGARPRMVLAAFPLVMALAYVLRGGWFAAVLALSAGSLALLTVLTAASLVVTP